MKGTSDTAPEDGRALPAKTLSIDAALRYRAAPLREEGRRLIVASDSPKPIQTADALRFLLRRPVEVVGVPTTELERLLEILPPSPDLPLKRSVPEWVERIIEDGILRRASDIHIEPLRERLRIRYRVDGILQTAEETPPLSLHPALVAHVKILAELRISEKRRPQDGRAKFVFRKDRTIDLRVSCIPSLRGESVVLRILDRRKAVALPDLGLDPERRKKLRTLSRLPNGLILSVGPTGSGKTTTLYALLRQLNAVDRKIVTVEDPVEYSLPGINQLQVRPAIGLTFSVALRSILRQAPNVILIGEIRDEETAKIAIRAALTGHLVISTLHANDAPSATIRLLELDAQPYLLASALKAVVAQRLVRKICPHCRKAPNSECRICRGTGYRGRTALFEMLEIDDPLRQAIRQRAGIDAIRAAAQAQGMRTLREDGLRKVAAGTTDRIEVLRVTMEAPA